MPTTSNQNWINQWLGTVPTGGGNNLTNAEIFGVQAAGGKTAPTAPVARTAPSVTTAPVAPVAPPAPTPVAPVTPTSPTTARTPGLLERARQDQMNLEEQRRRADEEANSYAAQMRQMRIDAINKTFQPRIEREKVEGQERLSRVAALNFKTGVTGSGVDTTRTGEQKGLNEKALQAIEDQKAVAIQEAFGWADKLAVERADRAYGAAKDSAEAKTGFYQEQAKTAMDALKVFGANGVDGKSLQEVDPDTYQTLREVSGMSDGQIDAYLKYNAPEGTYVWDQAQVVGNQMKIPKVVNGKVVMDTVDLGYTPKAGFKTAIKTDAGVVMINDDGTYDILPGTGDNDGGSSWGAISNNDKTDIENYLRTQPDFDASDLERVKNDRQFQAVILKEIEREKAAVYNPFQ